MSSWYFVKDGERNGPLRREELNARIAEGAVTGDTLVWTVGMSAWIRAGAVTELGLPPPLPTRRDRAEDADEQDDAERLKTRVETEAAYATCVPAASGMTSATRRPAAASAHAPVFAGFRIRFAAKIVDLVILYGIGLIVQGAVAALFFDGIVPLMLEDWERWTRFTLIAAPINVSIVLAYTVYFIRRHEATPGKRLLGLRVVRADGGRVGVGRVIGRYFAEQLSGLVFLVGYVMAAFDEEKRTLHDYLCGTRVVRGPREQE